MNASAKPIKGKPAAVKEPPSWSEIDEKLQRLSTPRLLFVYIVVKLIKWRYAIKAGRK